MFTTLQQTAICFQITMNQQLTKHQRTIANITNYKKHSVINIHLSIFPYLYS